MTTTESAFTLAGHLSVADPADLPASISLEILQALNFALVDYYKHSPRRFRQQTLSLDYGAPQTLSLTFTGARTLSGTPFANIPPGSTLQIEGLPGDTAVAGDSSIRDTYWDHTTTPHVSATLYRDVAPLPLWVDEILGDLLYHTATTTRQGQPLQPDERLSRQTGRSQAGHPRLYNLELHPAGRSSQEATATQSLRVWPLPATPGWLRFEALVSPRRLSFSEMEAGAPIPIVPQHYEAYFLPLALAYLTRSKHWANPAEKNSLLDAAERVRAYDLPALSPTSMPVRRRVGTPRGY